MTVFPVPWSTELSAMKGRTTILPPQLSPMPTPMPQPVKRQRVSDTVVMCGFDWRDECSEIELGSQKVSILKPLEVDTTTVTWTPEFINRKATSLRCCSSGASAAATLAHSFSWIASVAD